MGYTTTALATYVAVNNSSAVAHSNETSAQLFLVGGFLAVIAGIILVAAHHHYTIWKRSNTRAKQLATLKTIAPNWEAADGLRQRARLLYIHVNGNRKRFIELSTRIPLSSAGAATYYAQMQKELHGC